MGSETRLPEVGILFSPVTYVREHIELDPNFKEKLNSWIIENGEAEKRLKMITTWDSEVEPHEVDWIAEVLKQISPIDGFENSWGQIYGSGGFHPPHNHVSDENLLSGCLYLNDGPSTMFQDPLLPSRCVTKHVKAGDVMLWDPHLYHFSPPHESGRTILAFNLNCNANLHIGHEKMGRLMELLKEFNYDPNA